MFITTTKTLCGIFQSNVSVNPSFIANLTISSYNSSLNLIFSDDEKTDSVSSGSSVLAEPACTQLLNHRNAYHHITKNEEVEIQVRKIF